MSYTPPDWDAADLEFSLVFAPLDWRSVSLELSALADDHDQYVVYVGKIAPPDVPSPYQVSWRQYLLPAGLFSGGFGNQKIIPGYKRNFEFVDAYIPPDWDELGFEFGEAGEEQEITPQGVNAGSFGVTTIEFRNRQVGAAGIAPGAFGTPTAYLYSRYLLPSGSSYGAYGTASIANRNRYLLPTGIAAGGLGTATVALWQRYLNLTNRGIAPGSLGAAIVGNKNQYIIPVALNAFKGFGFAGEGEGFVDFAERTLRPTGIFAVTFGTQIFSQENRVVDLAGRGIVASYGTPLVAYRVRFLYPTWIPYGNFGYPTFDKTHYVDPSGWDSLEIGLQWVHDSRQFIEPEGFDAALYSAPWVSRSPRLVYPLGFPTSVETWPSTRWGIQTVENSRQYVFQFFEVTSGDGGVFGRPIWTFVLNRNRHLGTNGHRDSEFGPHTTVQNTGRALLPGGVSGPLWGANMVAYRIRSVYPPGVDSFWSTRWHVVLNSARVLAPVGIAPGAHGVPWFENTRRYFRFVGWDSSLFGTQFVAPAIRTITVPLGPESRFGVHDVQLWTRYVYPVGKGPGSQIGAANLYERFNRVFPQAILPKAVGDPYVRNATPEIRPYGYAQTIWGDNRVRHQYRHVYPSGPLAVLWGRHAVSDRTITVRTATINALRVGTNHDVRNNDPEPPYSRTIYPKDYIPTLYGQPSVRRNEIAPEGLLAVIWGPTRVAMMGCYPGSWASSKFGAAWVRGPRYIFPKTMPAPDDSDSEWYVRTVHDMAPRTIWARFDATEQALSNHPGMWELMDSAIDRENQARPRFGRPAVSNYYRGITGAGAIAPKAVGDHSLENKNRRILADGLRSLRMGIPTIPFTEVIDQSEFGLNAFAAGTPSLELQNRSVAALSVDDSDFGDARVENFHRELLAVGWDSFTSIGSPNGHRVHPPEPIIPAGLNATIWGATWVSHRIRTVETVGFDALDMTTAPGSFRDRMRVRNNSTVIGAKGLRSLESGVHSVVSVPIPVQSVDIIVEQQ